MVTFFTKLHYNKYDNFLSNINCNEVSYICKFPFYIHLTCMTDSLKESNPNTGM